MCDFSLLDLLRATGAFAIVLGAILLALRGDDSDQHLADAEPAGDPKFDPGFDCRFNSRFDSRFDSNLEPRP